MVTPLFEAFSVYPTPQSPLHRGSNLTLRCQYYEVFLINGVFSASGCLLCALEYALGARLALMQHRRLPVQLAVFLALSLPFQLCILDYPFADYRTFLLPFLGAGCIAALVALGHKNWTSSSSRSDSNQLLGADPVSTIDSVYLTGQNRHFNPLLAAYRSVLYICTALCIFSRDLPCWNNRFSKSKAFGTGLMDLGIGCFVICLGTVGPTAIRPVHLVDRSRALRRGLRQAALLSGIGLLVSIDRARQFNSLMAALQNPTAAASTANAATATAARPRFPAEWREYGVHWSAFHSLAVARLLGACLELLALPRWSPPLLAAAALAVTHEAALWRGLAELVLAPGHPEPYNRGNLFAQNREGLASVPGLVSLYMAGLQLGRWSREWWPPFGDGTTRRQLHRRLPTSAKMLALLVAALAWRPLVLATGSSVLPESRRLVSSAYCAWVVAFSCACLLSARLLMRLRMRLGTGRCLQVGHLASFDRAGALGFLVGNVATGLFSVALASAGIVDREAALGGQGRLCVCVALAYSLGTHAVALKLSDVRWRSALATAAATKLRTLSAICSNYSGQRPAVMAPYYSV